MNYAYDTSYFPPFPGLEIILRLPDETQIGPLSALMDTGADITIVPASLLDEAGAFPDEDGFLQDQWGGLHAIDFYTVKVIISGIHLPGIVVAGDQFSNELILGRNLLNKLTFLLDGPSLQTEVFESRPRIIRKS